MSKINLKEYARLFDRRRLKVDRSFNRRSVWDSKDANLYFQSLTRNRVPSPHVMADIEACLDFSEERADQASVEYYREWSSLGFKNLSLDGQNRGEKILALLNNEIAISGNFIDADGIEVEVENTFFKDLPRRLQDHFRTGCQIDIEIYKDVLSDELTDIFRNIQAGQPLNAQEKRNSTLSPIAPWVRDMRVLHEDVLARITKSDQITRMIDDENMAKMAMVLLGGNKKWGLSMSDIDSWYALGQGYSTLDDPSCPYPRKEMDRIEGILEMFGTVINNQSVYPASKIVPKKMWWAALYACEWVYDNDYLIHSKKDFFKKLKEIDDRLANDSEIEYSQECSKCLEKGIDPDEISKQDYYFRYQNLPHQFQPRKRRKKALVAEIKNNAKDMKIRLRPSKAKDAA